MKTLQAIRGMNDLLPAELTRWQYVESVLRQLFSQYHYQEIRLPIVERTELFKRSIGEVTDIVEKEMYTFLDRDHESLTLRPEGTAGCVRAAIENGLIYHQIQKLWYAGPMYRYERPQKGRYRQFYQVGVEVFGLNGPYIEAEILLLSARLWRTLKVDSHIKLQINCLGSLDDRARYRQAFVEYCHEHHAKLDDDSKRRLQSNPLRILDSKNPELQKLLHEAPKLTDYLSDDSCQLFEALCALLKAHGIAYEINPRLVRGLDYYTGLVFEWVTESLGAQGAVCAGGRYDGLVKQLGGEETPAVGFAFGLERLIALLELNEAPAAVNPDVFILGDEAQGLLLAEKLHDVLPTLKIVTHVGGGNFKAQFKKADKSGARFALILGEDEIRQAVITLKNLREDKPQQSLYFSPLVEFLRSV